jgi:hypothetical protein
VSSFIGCAAWEVPRAHNLFWYTDTVRILQQLCTTEVPMHNSTTSYVGMEFPFIQQRPGTYSTFHGKGLRINTYLESRQVPGYWRFLATSMLIWQHRANRTRGRLAQSRRLATAQQYEYGTSIFANIHCDASCSNWQSTLLDSLQRYQPAEPSGPLELDDECAA